MMKLNTGLRTALAAVALIVGPTASMGQRLHSTAADKPVWDKKAKDEVIEGMSRYVLNAAYVPGIDFAKWNEKLKAIREDADKAKNEEEFAGLINRGLNEQFNISHIVLMPPRAVEARTNRQTVGIGIRISIQPDGVLVTSVVPDAPAVKAGIEPGDVIMEANGHKVDGPQYIQGEVGTSVELKVRKADGSVKTYKVTRAQFSTVQPEELNWVNKDTAVLKVYTFDLAYSTKRVEELMTQAQSAKNLILDLRNNGGGAVMNMMHLLGMLLPEGTPVGTFVTKRAVDEYVSETKGNATDLPKVAEFTKNKLRVGGSRVPRFKGNVAVLVNGGSGSASEITAQALKEHLNAPVVGTKSAGAVLVSVMGQLPRGFNMQYPISDYVSIKGVRLEHNGVAPDSEVKDVVFLKKGDVDPAWTAAMNLLAAMNKSGN